jgi:hypothetical protein
MFSEPSGTYIYGIIPILKYNKIIIPMVTQKG